MNEFAAPPAARSGPENPLVLLVDDEAPLLQMLIAALEGEFSIMTALSTREAESLMARHTFKVIVSDHQMPGGNGLSFLVRMREEYPRTQRILLTGFMKPEMLLRSVNEAGLVRYFLKPVSIQELGKTMREAVKLYDAQS